MTEINHQIERVKETKTQQTNSLGVYAVCLLHSNKFTCKLTGATRADSAPHNKGELCAHFIAHRVIYGSGGGVCDAVASTYFKWRWNSRVHATIAHTHTEISCNTCNFVPYSKHPYFDSCVACDFLIFIFNIELLFIFIVRIYCCLFKRDSPFLSKKT